MSEYSTDLASNSITNPQSIVFDDMSAPYTLLEWIEKTSNTAGSADNFVDQYNIYVRSWRESSNNTASQNDVSIKDTYIRFLKEITIKYTTAEEKRYLNNIDFNDDNEADAAIPFFTRRIREIVETIYRGRQQSKFQKIKHSMRGSATGVEKSIFDMLIKYVSGETIINTLLPSKEHVTRNARSRVVETYDITQDYFDTEYMYTAGGQFVDEDGNDYVGYYVEQLLPDGRKLLVAGKGGSDITQSPRYISKIETGFVYTCHSIEIVSITEDPDDYTKKTLKIKSSGCDHWTYRVNDADTSPVHGSDSVVLSFSQHGTYVVVVSCVDRLGLIRDTDSTTILIDRNLLLQQDGSRIQLEESNENYLLWA